ncbi:MAG: TrmH family RNA methyltransferase [Vicinamibacterales bacterium]
MIEITSLLDRRVADYAYIGQANWLRERGLFVAEGRFVVRRLFEARTLSVRSVLVTRVALAALQDVLNQAGCPIYICEQDTMNQLAGFDFHRGCLALGERPPAIDPATRFQSARCLLAVQGVGNPDNVGGLFRVAAAFRVGGILLDRTSGDPLYRKAIRTSMGAAFTVPFAQTEEWLDRLAEFRASGADLVALTPDVSARDLSDYVSDRSPDRRIVLMLGAEGPGLSPEALDAATSTVRIPIAPAVDSLNVVVAAAIALAAVVNEPAAKRSRSISASPSSAAPSRDRRLT